MTPTPFSECWHLRWSAETSSRSDASGWSQGMASFILPLPAFLHNFEYFNASSQCLNHGAFTAGSHKNMGHSFSAAKATQIPPKPRWSMNFERGIGLLMAVNLTYLLHRGHHDFQRWRGNLLCLGQAGWYQASGGRKGKLDSWILRWILTVFSLRDDSCEWDPNQPDKRIARIDPIGKVPASVRLQLYVLLV